MDKIDVKHRHEVFETLGTKSVMVGPLLNRTYVPALMLESYGNLGEMIMPWSLMKLFDTGYLLEVWPYYGERYPRDQAMAYNLCCRLLIDPSLYDINSPKYPLVIDQTVRYVKTSSRRYEAVLRHPDRKQPYAFKTDVDVNIDPKTRKPKPFPNWWREKFNFPSDGPKLEYAIPTKPSDIVASQQRVHYSDIDANSHLNYAAYVKYCYDCFAENAFLKKYKRSDAANLLKNGLKSIDVCFVSDVLIGDLLTIESWQDLEDENTFHFVVKKGDAVCSRLTYEFFDKLSRL